MRFKVFLKSQDRYLSDEELAGKFYYTGQFDRSYPEPNPYIERFEVNLLNGKIQTNHDNACTDSDCCSPCEMFADDDDFILSVDDAEDTIEDLWDYLDKDLNDKTNRN